jgi:hypothetical protein
MFFNFKNKNMLIILLLLLVLASVFCYSLMMKSVEGNTNLGTTVFSENFTITKLDHLTNTEYYRINSNSGINEISFNLINPSISSLTPNISFSVTEFSGNVYDYMFKNSYDMYTKVIEIGIEYYQFYKITDSFSLNVIKSTDAAESLTASGESLTASGESLATDTTEDVNLGNVLFGIRNGDYTKVYSTSGSLLNITISITNSDDGERSVLIQNGILKVQPVTYQSTTADPNMNLTAATAISGGGSVNIGDINLPGGVPGGHYPPYPPYPPHPPYVRDAFGNYVPLYNQQMNPYMLPGSDPILMNQYNTPFYGDYSSFESAMNKSSNPLVNPVNSMNPIEYSQTLFGPWTTPMMTKTACLNCDESNEKVINRNDSDTSSNNINNNNNNDNNNNIFNTINSKANTMMAQNGEVDKNEGTTVTVNTKSGNSNNNFSEFSNTSNTSNNVNNNNQASCSSCGQCHDASNFECKKVPKYEMGLDNTNLPRPILSDFSTFGT